MDASKQEQAIDRAFELIATGKRAAREEGVKLLERTLGRTLQRYFERHKVPQAEAEELVWTVWLKVDQNVSNGKLELRGRAVVWLWTVARNLLISYHRGDSGVEVNFDDSGWGNIERATPDVARSGPAWIKLCIERGLAEFVADHPERGEVVRMLVEEWSAAEVGAFFGCSEGAARDRVYQTRKRVVEYIKHCKDDQ